MQGVGLLQKGFQILDLFSDERGPWTQVELARETGLARSTLGRLVRFLVARGYLMETRGRYTLGFAAVDLGRRAQSQFDLVDLAGDLLEQLAQATAETIILTVFDEARGCVTCLAQIPSSQGGLRVFESVGASYPLHSGATSKAVLAFLPERRRASVLDGDLTHVNSRAPSGRDRLAAEIEAVRDQGYIVTHDETYIGVTGVAAPILTPRGLPLGSIAIAAPSQRVDAATIAEFVARIQDAGVELATRLAAPAGAGEP